jgi:AbrB family looped-hinge helix DNA binding protein
MEKTVVTTKGQIVIPSKLRRRFGIKKGTQVFVYEKEGEIIVKPITDEYIESMAGMTGTKGKLLKALGEEKAKERLL